MIANQVLTQLTLSDRVVTGNLLRFYHPSWFTPVKTSDYDYNKTDSLKKLEEAGKSKTSLKSQLGKKDASSLYKTDAPELKKTKTK